MSTAWRSGKGDATQTFEDYEDFRDEPMPAKTISHDGEDLSIDLITSVTYDDVGFPLPDAVQKALAAGEIRHQTLRLGLLSASVS